MQKMIKTQNNGFIIGGGDIPIGDIIDLIGKIIDIIDD